MRNFLVVLLLLFLNVSVRGADDVVVQVLHSPSINGTVCGSVHQMNGENVYVNGNAVVEGDFLVPGTPQVTVNGNVEYCGIVDGDGDSSPSDYTVMLNGGASLGTIVRQTNPVSLPVAEAFVEGSGSEYVTLNKSGGYSGDFLDLRGLTLQGKAGIVPVPPGSYGAFIANSKTGFILGVSGDDEPSVYYFESLTLNSHSQLQIVGPVILVVKSSLNVNAFVTVGNESHPEWLIYQSRSGDLCLNAQSMFYGGVILPDNQLTVNAQSELVGQVWSSRLIVNANGVLRYYTVEASNQDPFVLDLEVQVFEDSTAEIYLEGDDADGDSLTYHLLQQPTNGVLSGTVPELIYAPNANYNGSDSFTYCVSDGVATSEVGVVTVKVIPVNDSPVASGQSLSVNEDELLSVDLFGFDEDGDALSYQVVTLPENGTLSGSMSNVLYAPASNYNGGDSFTYCVSDGVATSEVGVVTVEVIPVNDVPTGSDLMVEIDEDQALSVEITGGDVDGDELSCLILSGPTNGVLSGVAGTYQYTPAANYNGKDSVLYAVSDGVSTSGVYCVEITVFPVNDSPVASGQSLSVNEDEPLSVDLFGFDEDGDALSYQVVTLPENGTLSGTVPDLIYTPVTNFYGEDKFEFAVNDGVLTSSVAAVSLKILPVNDAPSFIATNPPVITYIDGFQRVEGWATFNAGAENEFQNPQYVVTNIADSANYLSFPAVSTNGTLRYEITNGVAGTFSFDVYVKDDGGVDCGGMNVSPVQTFSIAVEEAENAAPVVDAGSDQSDDFAISKGTNLVVNPGAENDPQLGWISVDETEWQAVDGSVVTAFEGNCCFYPGSVESGEIYQDVDLSDYAAAIDAGVQDFSFRTVVQSKDELRPDYASVELQFWGDDLLDVHTFSPEPSEGLWLVLSGVYMPPAGTRFARIRLLAERKLSDNSCDTWFDGIELCPLTYPVALLTGTVSDDGLPWGSCVSQEWTLVSGDSAFVNILTPSNTQSFVVFKSAGTYEFRLVASDSELSGQDRVVVEWEVGSENQPPVVAAGEDMAITLPTNRVSLAGIVTDDGLPSSNSLSCAWVLDSGPAEIFFDDQSSPDTDVYFREAGTYVLRLNVSDGELSAGDEVVVTVNCGITPIDLGLAIDHSGSMGTATDTESKLYLARQSAMQLLAKMSPVHDMACLSSLNVLSVGLNSDFDYLQDQVSSISGASSATDDGIGLCCDEIFSNGRSNATPVIIVLADGQTSEVYDNASAAKSAGMRVITIGYGTGVNDDYLRELASSPADYYFVGEPEDIDVAFATIGRMFCRDANESPDVYIKNPLVFAEVGESVLLNGYVNDDGVPFWDTLTYEWSLSTTNGYISDATSLFTSVSFDQSGIYIVDLIASDGLESSFASKTVIVESPCGVAIPSGVISYWPLDRSAQDIIGRNSGEADWLYSSASSFGVHFDGSILTIPESSSLDVGAENGFTLEFWMKPDSVETTTDVLGWSKNVCVRQAGDGLSVQLKTDSVIGAISAGNVLSSNSWTHVGVIFDNLNDQLSICVNGTEARRYSVRGDMLTGEKFSMGVVSDTGFVGALDDVALYGRALSYSDMYEQFSAGRGGKCLTIGNLPPSVNAGADRVLSQNDDTFLLQGEVSDDGLPYGQLDVQWTQLYGPADVVFGDSASSVSSAYFPASGVYVLQLSADDGYQAVSDTVAVRVGLPCDVDVQDDVVSWWRADGNFEDEAGRYPAEGIWFGDGISGGAFLFQGDNVVQVSDAQELDLGDNREGFSYECWICPETASSGTERILGWSDSVYLARNDDRLYAYYTPDGSYKSYISENDVLRTNHWTHVITVFDNESDKFMLYVDGELKGSKVVSANLQTTASFTMGNGFEGLLDEVAVYNRALYPEEVAAFYAAGAEGKCFDSENSAPEVDAGSDRGVEIGESAMLNGSVYDDGLPFGSLDLQWEKLYGPGDVLFANDQLPVTSVQFSLSGVYVLQLSASDGYRTSCDIVEVQVGLGCDVNISDDVVSWWRANGEFEDETGLNPAMGTLFSEGVSGGAFRFTGDNVVRLPEMTGLNVGTNASGFSYECWICPESNSGSGVIAGWTGLTYLYRSGQALYAKYTPEDSSRTSVSKSSVLDSNRWTHAVAVFDNEADTYTLYVNGVLESRKTVVANIDTTAAFTMGDGFDGRLDEVAVYNRALTQEEVAELYTAGAEGKCYDLQNRAPEVDAGPDATLATVSQFVMLDGSVSDDGFPYGSLSICWEKRYGPGEVVFGDKSLPITTAQFSTSGVYVLELTASDGYRTSMDLVEIRVAVPCERDLSGDVVSWWRANGDFEDETGLNPAAGTLFAEGVSGGAFRFDGDHIVRLPESTGLNVGTNASGFSYECWICPESNFGSGTIFGWSGSTRLYRSDQTLRAYYQPTKTSNLDIYRPSALSSNRWTHAVAVFDNEADEYILYVNGLPVDSATVSSNLYTTANFTIGSGFEGRLDDVAVYNRALTQEEVAELYAVGADGKCFDPENSAPLVNAGADTVAEAGEAAMLNGSVTDDGVPYGSLDIQWEKLYGPGDTVFANDQLPVTTAQFSTSGVYVLQLTASDGYRTSSDIVEVQVDVGCDVDISEDIVSWWRANGDFEDETGLNPAAGTLFGEGVSGGAFRFDGDNIVRLPEMTGLNVGTNAAGFSCECWICPDSSTAGWGRLLGWGDSVYLQRVNRALYAYYTPEGSSRSSMYKSSALSSNSWTHAVAVFDNEADTYTLYVNGVLGSRKTVVANIDTTAAFTMGDGFDGRLDEVAVYNRALTDEEVAALYAAGADGKCIPSESSDPGQNTAPVVDAGTNQTVSVDAGVWLRGTVTDDGLPAGTLDVCWYLAAGSLDCVFATNALTSTNVWVGFEKPGDYTMMLYASDGELYGMDTVTVTVTDGAGTNQAPRVNAGVDATISTFAAQLNPTVEDDGLPNGSSLNYQWSVVQGAGSVLFDDSTLKRPVVRFGSAGTYILQVVVSDGELSAVDMITITVYTGANQAPVVDVGSNLVATLSAGADLSATVTDDGLPDGTLSYNWYLLDGPTDVVYAYGPLTNTDVWVGFDMTGVYTLALYASDGELYGADSLEIDVRSVPAVQLTSPTNTQGFADSEFIHFSAVATDSDGIVSSVEFFVNDISVGAVTNEPFAISMTNALPEGLYSAYAVGTDDDGNEGQSSSVLFSVGDVAVEPVWAELVSPTNNQVVTEPVDLFGTVSSAMPDAWVLQYREVTSANDGEWMELGQGTDAGENIKMGTFDPTLLRNGFYEFQIHATDQLGFEIFTDPVPVQVAGAMKIGAFSLAFEDVTVPVAGVPMSVTRMYDSCDAVSGDFGHGWNLDFSTGIRLRKNRNLGKGWYGGTFPFELLGYPTQGYYLDSNGDRIVTVNLPDGTAYKFRAFANVKEQTGLFADWPDNYRWIAPFNMETSLIEFRPMDGTVGQLIPLTDDNRVSSYCFATVPTGLMDLHPDGNEDKVWNPTRFKLITEDGTELILDEDLGLIRMEDKNGNWLEIDEDGVVHSSGKTLRFVRSDDGIITEVVDPAGQSLKYRYDGQNRLIEFENRAGEITEYFYENAQFPNYLTRIVDPAGNNAIRTEYDDQGRIVSQTDADGQEITFEHAMDDNMEIITDRLGRQTVHVYDDSGRVVETVQYLDGREISTRREYDENGRETKVIDPLGHETVKVYGPEKNQVLREIRRAPNGQGGYSESISYNSYDEDGNLTAMTDFGGKTTGMAYDSVGNLTAMTNAAGNAQQFVYSGGNLSRITDAGGTVTEMTYDGSGNRASRLVKNKSNYLQEYQTFQYDANGNETNTVDYLVPANSRYTSQAVRYRETHTAYDAENRATSSRVFDADGNLLLETGTAYNALGKKAAETNALGLVTRYVYDAAGNLTETHIPDGRIEYQYYDFESRLLQVETVSSNNVVLSRETYDYDELDRKIRVTQLDGSYTEADYDDIGRVTTEFDAFGTPTLFEYDPTCACGGRRTAVIDALGNAMHYTYDESGSQTSATDANGHITEFFYDDLGRQTNVVYHDGISTSTEYDAAGRRSAEVDAMGNRKEYGYDALGRLISVTTFLTTSTGSTSLTTSYTYDSLGRMLTQTDAENHTTTFEYDELGRRTARVLPGGERETFTCNAGGNPLTHTDFNGYTTTCEYDAVGRLTAEVVDPSHPSLTLDHAPARIEYAYDAAGNRTKETLLNASGVQIHKDWMAYNEKGDMLWHHSSYNNNEFAHAFTYGRDAAGNLTNLLSSTEGGASTALSYDELNRLSSVSTVAGVGDPGTQIASYTYDAVGSLSAVQYANGITHAYTYDSLNRLTNLIVSAVDPVSSIQYQVSGYAYTLDANGYRTSVTEADGRATSYTYDDLGRLTREHITGDPTVINGWSDYAYDNVGNRLSRSSEGFMPAAQDFNYDANDRMYGADASATAYDANGNTILSDATPTSTALTNSTISTAIDTYDFRNRLIRREYESGLVLDYTYNARGTRISKAKRIGGVLVSCKLFVVDDQNLTGYVQTLEEWTADGYDSFELDKVYDYGLDLIAQTGFEDVVDPDDPETSIKSPVSSFYCYDGRGSVRALTDELGAVTDSYTYDAFGIQLFQTGNTDNAYRYCGEYYDADLGLYYLRARHMNPETGRFHTMDGYDGRIGEPLSLHKYMYAHANPVMGVDPSGYFTLVELMNAINIMGVRVVKPIASYSYQIEMTKEIIGFATFVYAVGAAIYNANGSSALTWAFATANVSDMTNGRWPDLESSVRIERGWINLRMKIKGDALGGLFSLAWGTGEHSGKLKGGFSGYGDYKLWERDILVAGKAKVVVRVGAKKTIEPQKPIDPFVTLRASVKVGTLELKYDADIRDVMQFYF